MAIQKLESAIKTPLPLDTTLYRAIPNCTEFLKLEIGANYQPDSFTSTCRTWKLLTTHLKPGLNPRRTPAAVLTLRVPKGHTVLNVTPAGVDEDEVLLKPGISWILISRSNGRKECYSSLPANWMSNFWEICFEVK
ncbi:hypothetical protein [Gluconobacter wancherniae]|uniref:hypothetical protein n=1 Tax=Gluconobacter wancherniae TaxID=1307955 RepID=UPI001B8A948E|nr:hypothetical protein [Gluconobacter wancherniae]MBS1095257.1 hypothetical protein [Gluconobacter wancherniae]